MAIVLRTMTDEVMEEVQAWPTTWFERALEVEHMLSQHIPLHQVDFDLFVCWAQYRELEAQDHYDDSADALALLRP